MKVSTQVRLERAWVEVDLTQLVANARTAQAAAQGARLLPMVKADAYGLGVIPIVRALEPLEPWGYGVATVDEGIELRGAGIHRPVIVFTPARADQQARYHAAGLRAVLDDPSLAATWHGPFHLEIDTGMGRAGLRWDVPGPLAHMHSEQLEGVFTHFHSADTDPASVATQWRRFQTALESLPHRPPLVHAGNSAGAFRLAHRLDLVRPGIFLYGGALAPDLPAPAPVVAVRARIVSLRRLAAGATVSYGAEWRAARDAWVATLAIGYADGVPRSVQGRASVLVHGRCCPLIGRVTMDMVAIELPDERGVNVGDVATLIGDAGGCSVSLDQFAAWAGTISYEILTGLGRRLPRIYHTE